MNCIEYKLPEGRNFCSFASLLYILVPRIILAQNILSKYLLNEYNTFLMYKNMLLSISLNQQYQGWNRWVESGGERQEPLQ